MRRFFLNVTFVDDKDKDSRISPTRLNESKLSCCHILTQNKMVLLLYNLSRAIKIKSVIIFQVLRLLEWFTEQCVTVWTVFNCFGKKRSEVLWFFLCLRLFCHKIPLQAYFSGVAVMIFFLPLLLFICLYRLACNISNIYYQISSQIFNRPGLARAVL